MNGKKILVVDDDKGLLLALSIRLRASGYNVVSATDGISALNTVRDERPDLILLDIGLPGNDGFTFMGKLSSFSSGEPVPIIMLTARNAAGNEERSIGAGAKAFLQKPVDNNLLLATIQANLAN